MNQRAMDATLVAVDFETTGVAGGYSDEPWQVGMVRISGGHLDVEGCFESWLRVGDRPFSVHAPGRHAEVRAELISAPTLAELWPEIRAWWLTAPLVAHNTAAERKVISTAAPLHRPAGWIDTLALARVAYPERGSHTLTDLVEGLRLKDRVEEYCPGRTPHDALYDAVACGVLLVHLLKLEGWEDATVEALQRARPDRYYRARARPGREPGWMGM